MQGAIKVKKKYPETILLFVTAPSAEEVKKRLIGRNTESMDVIDARMQRAYEESFGLDDYDYLVINDELDECVECVNDIIMSERAQDTAKNESHRVSANIDFINNIRKELLSYSKGV